MAGQFLVFEGGEGTGKSTVISWLEKELQVKGKEVVVTREPGGTALAEKLRDLVVIEEEGEEKWCALAEYLIFAGSRAQHIDEKILPALQKDKWVLCDRFMDSSWVYQGYVRGVSHAMIERVHQELVKQWPPNLTLFFDLDPQIGLDRATGRMGQEADGPREDRFENQGLDFHKKVREGYQKLLSKKDVERATIDASQSIEDVQKQVWKLIEERCF